MALFIGFGIFCILVLIGVVLWLEVRTLSERVRLFKMALESNQKKLDTQNSKLNILSNALPHLQAAILQKPDSDGWRVLVLDETRALLRADGASYWAYAEDRHLLECDVARGLESNPQGQVVHLSAPEGDIVECAKNRISVVKNDESVASEAKRTLCAPMEIAGRLAGVFRFVRHGGEAFQSRDADMVLMFMKQVALCIENRDMVNHRETFYLELVQTLADILDAKDASTEGHTRRMRSLARAIGRELHMPDEFIYYLEFAALMHDIGKIGIDESLLKKPGKLTPEEFAIIKKHPEIGHKILSPVTMLAPVAPMVLYHQEWFNGKGYPEGLSGEEIPLGARIVAIIDAYSAMTSSRPWRPALTDAQVIAEVRKGAGTQFDPKVVDAFLAIMERQQLAA